MSEVKHKRPIGSIIGRPLLAGALAAAAATPVSAVADIFLKLDDIQGESTDAKHKNEINILSYTQSFKNTLSTAGSAGKVVCGDVTVLKNIDKSSPELIKGVTTGKHYEKAVISFRSINNAKTSTDYYVVTLQDVLITSIDQTDQPDPAKIVERVSLNAQSFQFKYTQQAASGATVGSALTFTFNCNENKAQ
jgi:type VI secretion system secreted protein Hcp